MTWRTASRRSSCAPTPRSWTWSSTSSRPDSSPPGAPEVPPPRRAFVDLRAADVEAASPVRSTLFLGRLDPAALRRELEEAGIVAGLAARGYDRVQIRTTLESGEHRLRVLPVGGSVTLVDL